MSFHVVVGKLDCCLQLWLSPDPGVTGNLDFPQRVGVDIQKQSQFGVLR